MNTCICLNKSRGIRCSYTAKHPYDKPIYCGIHFGKRCLSVPKEQTKEQTKAQTKEQTKAQTKAQTKEQTKEQIKEQTKEQIKEQIKEQTKEQTKEPKKKIILKKPYKPHKPNKHFTELDQRGVLVIPLITDHDLQEITMEFWQTLMDFPEYKSTPSHYVLESFGALGNPSSFHNPLVRKLRMQAHGVLSSILDTGTSHLQALFDRMRVRYKGRTMTAESWHRDQSVNMDGIFYGGWINLGSTQQFFSCDPGSHKDIKSDKSGFIRSEQPVNQEIIVIPPGSIIIFHADILHEVVKREYKIDTPRLFTSWRLTTDTNTIYGKNLHNIITYQGVPPLPSGNPIDMYTANTGRFRQALVVEWSQSFVDQCKSTTKSGKVVVHRYMKSLKEYGLPLYSPYSDAELTIFL